MRNANISVKVSRYGHDTIELHFDEEPTLQEVIDETNYDLSTSEKENCSVNGQLARMSSIIEDGDTVQIVGKKEGGR